MRAERRSRRALERRVERRHRLRSAASSASSIARDASANDSSTAGGICASSSSFSAASSCALQRLERQLVLREEAQRRRIEQRRRRARIHQRHRHAEVLVDAAQLAEVRQLVRSGDVTDRREQRVLHDRAQQHVRAEAGRAARWPAATSAGGAKLLVADDEAGRPAGGSARRVRRRGGTARGCRPARAPARGSRAPTRSAPASAASLTVSPGRRQLAREHLADERLRRRIRRVVDDQAARSPSTCFEPAAERVGHAGARRVGAPQIGQQRGAEFGGRQQSRRARRAPL